MPVITLEAAQLTKEQKCQLARALTDTAAEIMEMPQDTFYVFLKENGFENIAVSGQLLSDKRKVLDVV